MSRRIHPSAIISKKAKVADSVEVGPYSVISDKAEIQSGCSIGANCVIDGNTKIGKNCKIFTGVVIGSIPQDLKFKGEKTQVIIGNNNIIREYTTINLATSATGKTTVGNDNLLMAYTHIAHDCVIGNNCVIANCGTLAGHVTIEDRAVVGGLVAIHQFTRVGALSIIGGCSKVVQDVPPYSTCDGHPTKVFGINSIGLERAGLSKDIIQVLKRAFKILFFSELSFSHAIERVNKELPSCKELTYLVNFIQKSERGICR
jgi:UDP-N-acetylglucosamine acyltransferase